jgi:hypothetical protein
MPIICCRLLVKNVGQPTDENHKVAPCEKCGQLCIERPELEAEALKHYPDAKAWCTECAVKAAMSK